LVDVILGEILKEGEREKTMENGIEKKNVVGGWWGG
jgi:hypothetical protein